MIDFPGTDEFVSIPVFRIDCRHFGGRFGFPHVERCAGVVVGFQWRCPQATLLTKRKFINDFDFDFVG
jgi:hypothetical protein